jgi:hypothetical protein
VTDRLGKLDDLDGARAVRHAPDEAAFLESGDKAVDSRLGTQIERILHLVERRRNPAFLQSLVDETQELELFARQHNKAPKRVTAAAAPKQIMNRPYLFDMCSATT